jgi:hypothetical protein
VQLRHPNVLAFKDSLELQEKGQTVLYLVTEAVRPLAMVLKELDISGQHRRVNEHEPRAAAAARPYSNKRTCSSYAMQCQTVLWQLRCRSSAQLAGGHGPGAAG